MLCEILLQPFVDLHVEHFSLASDFKVGEGRYPSLQSCCVRFFFQPFAGLQVSTSHWRQTGKHPGKRFSELGIEF